MNKVTLASAVARFKRRELRKQKAIFNLEQQEKKLSTDDADTHITTKYQNIDNIGPVCCPTGLPEDYNPWPPEKVEELNSAIVKMVEIIKELEDLSLDKQNQES